MWVNSGRALSAFPKMHYYLRVLGTTHIADDVAANRPMEAHIANSRIRVLQNRK